MTDDERGPEMGLLEQLFGIYTPRIQPPPVMFSDLPPAAINELQCGVLPQLNVGSLRLRKGEICHYVDKCCLFIKKVERHYRRVSRGSSFHVAKGLTVHTGSGESHPIEQELPEYTPGYLYITNQRVIFTAREKGFEKDLSPFGTSLGIMGKQRWMAPEIVTGGVPDKQSDRFSLAVVLFRLLFINHPLEGRYSTPPCMTKELERKYYGTAPVFIYDPDNQQNRPIPGTDQNLRLFWPAYPQYIRDAFIRAFSNDVMMKKAPRILEIEWLNLFFRLRAETVWCGSTDSATDKT